MRKFRAQSPAPPPKPPGPTHIHHHQPGEMEKVLSRVVGLFLSVGILWLIGLFLLNQAGVRNPNRTLAIIVVWVAVALCLMFFFRFTLIDLWDRWLSHREEIERERTQQVRYQQMLAGSAVVDTRTTGDRQRLTALILHILIDAYHHVATSGPYRGGERPWSRRQAAGRTLTTLGESAPVGEALGGKVRPFLEQHQIIINDQLNLEQFPDLASVQRLLYQPLLLNRPQQAMLPAGEGASQERSNWSIIE